MAPNDRYFVKYRGFPTWHERWVLAIIDGRLYLIATPDFDLYPELASITNPDIEEMRFGGPCGRGRMRLPHGVRAAYQFDAVPVAQARDLLREGEALAAAERRRLGVETPRAVVAVGGGVAAGAVAGGAVLPLAGGAAAAAGVHDGGAAAVRGVAPAGVWRVMETSGRLNVGDRHLPSPTAVTRADRGIDDVDGRVVVIGQALEGESALDFAERVVGRGFVTVADTDARVLPIQTRAGDGKRERTWPSVCDSVKACALPDFAVTGPRTAEWCLRYLQRQQMHPDDYHIRWRQRHKLGPADWGVTAHQTGMRCLAIAGCSDQLDLPNLAVIEHILRECQMCEHHYRQIEKDLDDKQRRDKKVGGMPMDEADLFLGVSKSMHDTMVCPELQEFIAKALERDANIQKQTRKAREERTLARK